jgi:hypothetical protein
VGNKSNSINFNQKVKRHGRFRVIDSSFDLTYEVRLDNLSSNVYELGKTAFFFSFFMGMSGERNLGLTHGYPGTLGG